ncbi:uncharacterized protein A1O9_09502 [Exophiala aquamarina CBS 119918]|uniref:Uncharacterized protein n=1 Tax=Exophiala aquamarina CBS 119918 TaxID=1182545 RepID=A0A072P3D6_9EURO|nr:uncharacterized protein A1O9_09502 [Exophiala aquamarina CBS 119918]KEF54336.1 hypothetical protein A1O9_09502 [Exophiala aquamarina CBS 119918]
MQISMHEPGIRHAVIALSALYENYEHPQKADKTSSKFAIQHYGRAIQRIIKVDTSRPSQAADAVLIACILFTAFECLQGRYKSAVTHVASGINTFAEGQAQPATRKHGYVSGDIIRTMFLRLETQALELDDNGLETAPKTFYIWRTIALPPTFQTIEEARVSVDICLNRLLHLFKKATDSMLATEVVPSTETIRAIEVEYAQIDQYYRDFSDKLDLAKSPPSDPGVLLLEISRALVRILLELDFSRGEMLFDHFHDKVIYWSSEPTRTTHCRIGALPKFPSSGPPPRNSSAVCRSPRSYLSFGRYVRNTKRADLIPRFRSV